MWAPTTLTKYRLVINNLLDWADGGDVPASRFSEDHFWKFAKHMRQIGLADKTVYDRLTIVKQMFKSALRRQLIAANSLAGLSMSKPAPTVQPCFTPAQVAAMLAEADVHLQPILATMAYTGLRFGEVRDLQWGDLDLNHGRYGVIMVRRGGSSGTTKTKRVRMITIHPALREILDGLTPHTERIFSARPSRKHPNGDGPLNERRLLMSLKRLCRRCGFHDPNKYKLHTFRHTFASMCARNNVSYKYALDWMGHRNSDILDLYYTAFDDTAEAAMRTIEYSEPTVADKSIKAKEKSFRKKKESPHERRKAGRTG